MLKEKDYNLHYHLPVQVRGKGVIILEAYNVPVFILLLSIDFSVEISIQSLRTKQQCLF